MELGICTIPACEDWEKQRNNSGHRNSLAVLPEYDNLRALLSHVLPLCILRECSCQPCSTHNLTPSLLLPTAREKQTTFIYEADPLTHIVGTETPQIIWYTVHSFIHRDPCIRGWPGLSIQLLSRNSTQASYYSTDYQTYSVYQRLANWRRNQTANVCT
jgi:hypothetical protein